MILNEGQIEYVYDEYISEDKFKLLKLVMAFDYEQITHTKRRKYFEPHIYNPWRKSDA